jgi:hypothetical protein
MRNVFTSGKLISKIESLRCLIQLTTFLHNSANYNTIYKNIHLSHKVYASGVEYQVAFYGKQDS